ncbi:flagellar biosynthesis anti-sigma factor FlgM [Parasalinivibrio latis]|uniref:flagellar biosynthesis anti-sigma factor FlgM n=1 Tax=Parasalinivibrio latis TaxID=2952610 RepID=UPI0030E290FE
MPGINQLRPGQTYVTSKTNQDSARSGSVSRESPESPRSKGDSVSLSSEGRAIGQMQNQLASEPQFDSAKVARIKQAIADGSYSIDADKLASNIMKFEDELKDIR